MNNFDIMILKKHKEIREKFLNKIRELENILTEKLKGDTSDEKKFDTIT